MDANFSFFLFYIENYNYNGYIKHVEKLVQVYAVL